VVPPCARVSLELGGNAVAGQELEQMGRGEPRCTDAVRHHHDHRRLRAVGGIELSVLVRLAWACRAWLSGPGPELCEVKTGTAGQPPNGGSARLRRVRDGQQQVEVLRPVRQQNRPRETGTGHQDVVRRGCLSGRSQHNHRCHGNHRNRCARHIGITPSAQARFHSEQVLHSPATATPVSKPVNQPGLGASLCDRSLPCSGQGKLDGLGLHLHIVGSRGQPAYGITLTVSWRGQPPLTERGG
jgi:hypothetical protein